MTSKEKKELKKQEHEKVLANKDKLKEPKKCLLVSMWILFIYQIGFFVLMNHWINEYRITLGDINIGGLFFAFVASGLWLYVLPCNLISFICTIEHTTSIYKSNGYYRVIVYFISIFLSIFSGWMVFGESSGNAYFIKCVVFSIIGIALGIIDIFITKKYNDAKKQIINDQ